MMKLNRQAARYTTVLMALGMVLLAACDVSRALMGFRDPVIAVANPVEPVTLTFREGPGGLVLLRGKVNGVVDAEFILDTGAPVTVLINGPKTKALNVDMSRARKLGPDDDPAVPFGVIAPKFRIEFDGLTLSELTTVVIPQDSLPCQDRFAAVDFQGVIGADLFRHFVVEIDHAAKRVRLFNPKTWQPGSGALIPLINRNGHIFADLTVDQPTGKLPLRFHIDTGKNTALSLDAGSHPGLTMPTNGTRRKSCYVQGVIESIEGPPTDVYFGNLVANGVAPQITRRDRVLSGERNGSIGIALLKRYVVTFDYAGKRMLLQART